MRSLELTTKHCSVACRSIMKTGCVGSGGRGLLMDMARCWVVFRANCWSPSWFWADGRLQKQHPKGPFCHCHTCLVSLTCKELGLAGHCLTEVVSSTHCSFATYTECMVSWGLPDLHIPLQRDARYTLLTISWPSLSFRQGLPLHVDRRCQRLGAANSHGVSVSRPAHLVAACQTLGSTGKPWIRHGWA